jgi:hypothetical protein
MTHTFKLAKRTARLRAPLLVLLTLSFAACDSADRLTNNTAADPSVPVAAAPSADSDTTLALADTLGATDLSDPVGGMAITDDEAGAETDPFGEEEDGSTVVVSSDDASTGTEALSLSAFRGGIPFGTFHLPANRYGAPFNGTASNISAHSLVAFLQQARRAGTRVILSFSGNERYFKNANKSFSMAKWMARVARYKGLNLTPYIKDGTIIAHYLFDEPHDPANWGGRTVSRATVDAMAKYSKKLWPSLPTVVRSWPSYLRGYRYRYLDAAWAQYSERKGPVTSFLNKNVADAKKTGLGLVVGLNLLDGGTRASRIKGYSRGHYAMSASQIRAWGSVLLKASYACAFLSWQYDTRYMGRSDIKAALNYLSGRARSSGARSCRGT